MQLLFDGALFKDCIKNMVLVSAMNWLAFCFNMPEFSYRVRNYCFASIRNNFAIDFL